MKKHLSTESYFEQGVQFFNAQKYEKAIEQLEKALEQSENDNKTNKIFQSLITAFCYVSNYEAALVYALQNEKLLQALHFEEKLIAENYNLIGNCYLGLRKMKLAQIYYEKSLNLFLKIEGEIGENTIRLYNDLGVCYNHLGKYKKTLEYYQKSIAVYENNAHYDNTQLARFYNNIAIHYFYIGNYSLSINFAEKALQIWKQQSEKNEKFTEIAKLYFNLSATYGRKSDYEQQYLYLQQARHIFEEKQLTLKTILANIYEGMAWYFGKKKDFKNQLLHYEYARQILVNIFSENHLKIAQNYTKIATAYRNLQDYEKALCFYEKALSLQTKQLPKNHPKIANTLKNIGLLYIQKKESYVALSFFEKALKMSFFIFGKKNAKVAEIYQNIAKIYLHKKQFIKALHYFQKSIISLYENETNLNVYRNLTLKNSFEHQLLLLLLHEKAQAFHLLYEEKTKDIIDLKTSLKHYTLAFELINKIRHSYKAEGSKFLLVEKVNSLYEVAIKIAMKLYGLTGKKGYGKLAFSFSEQNRAIILLTGIRAAEAKKKANIPAIEIENLQNLGIELTYLEKEISKKQNHTTENEERLRNYKQQYFSLKEEYDQLIRTFEINYPQYYRLKYDTSIATISTLHKKMSEKNCIVKYFVSQEFIYIFLIKKHHFSVKKVAAKRLENLANEYLQSLKTVDIQTYLQTAFCLYERLLKPIENDISAAKNLLIIPHDYLLKLPFESLLIQKNETDFFELSFAKLPYLLNKFEITYHYSTTLWLETKEKEEKKADSFLAFAPISFHKKYASLPKTEGLVQKIQFLFEKDKQENKVFLHENATVTNFKQQVENYKYLLIATHGIIDNEQTNLSNFVFSPAEKEHQLFLVDTYNLKLSADLVVLSACESGIGRFMKGEGMMAMNRGFMYSGANNLIFTLFKVQSKASSELLVQLFQFIKNGENYKTALRLAKQHLIAQNHFPRMWAGFVLIGK